MTKSLDNSNTDSEIGSIDPTRRVNKLSAILCPAICALLIICMSSIIFLGSKMAHDQYDAFCMSRRFDVGKLYIFPNVTMKFVKDVPQS